MKYYITGVDEGDYPPRVYNPLDVVTNFAFRVRLQRGMSALSALFCPQLMRSIRQGEACRRSRIENDDDGAG